MTATTAHRFPGRPAALVLIAALAATALAACGSTTDVGSHASASSSASAASVSGARHDAQDVAFAEEMIPHHRQAVEMAALAQDRAGSQAVRQLAAAIEKAQDPEITRMSGWLRSWGESVPSAAPSASTQNARPMPSGTPMPGMSGMDHSAHGLSGTPGMMSAADMDKLGHLSAGAFDTAFLTMMISHHQGALAMARTEQAKGSYGPAKDLASSIVTSQTAEITRMKALLAE